MFMKFVPLRFFALWALLAVLFVPPARAGGWQEAPHSRARLIPGGLVAASQLAGRTDFPAPAMIAGLEIQLEPGWKTYWRTPGDGIAPRFDWSGAQNVAATEVLWPVPDHFRDAAGAYNGYQDRVVLPILVAPERPDAPVALDLGLDYAVCKDVCIPVSKRLSLRFSADDTRGREAVLAALRDTPVRADARGRCGETGFQAVAARLEGEAPRLKVTVAHAGGLPADDLFVEASSGRFMAHPQRLGGADGRTVFAVDPTAGGDPRGLAGETLTLTAVWAAQSCEMAWTVE